MAETLAILGLVAAAPPIIDGIFKTWDSIVRKRENYQAVTSLARDLRSFGTDDSRAQLYADITLARRVLEDNAILSEQKDRIARIFQKIHLQLYEIDDLVDVVLQKPNRSWFLRRTNESKELRNKVEQSKRDITEFHGLIMSFREISTSGIGNALLETRDFCLTVDAEKTRIQLNDMTFIARGSRALPGKSSQIGLFVFESKYYEPGKKKEDTKKDLQSLSTRLLRAEPTCSGIFPLIGFRDEPGEDEFQLVFSHPFADNPDDHCIYTLRNFYTSSTTMKPSLNFRVNLCRQLAEAVLQTHTLGLVHKSIRPDNILLCFPQSPPSCTGEPPRLHLSGWHFARPASGHVTNMAGESSWRNAIYQYPTRQMRVAEEEYCIGHDIYSLGVCMLEILMWDPLVVNSHEGPTISQSYQTTYHSLGLQPEPSTPHPTTIPWVTRVPKNVHGVLVEMAATCLPFSAGQMMADLVHQCLTCLVPEGIPVEFMSREVQARKEISEGFVDIILGGICSVLSVI